MTVAGQPRADERFVTWVDWEGYGHILEALKRRRLKITYDRGTIELLSPSRLHEAIKRLLGQLVEMALYQAGVDYQPGGSTTFRRKLLDRGLEPDECYYFSDVLPATENEEPEEVPVPDLVLEIEVTRSALDRLGIYQALGVREVWRYSKDHQLRIEVLGEDGYTGADRSSFLPQLAPSELVRLVRLGLQKGSTAMLRDFTST